MPKTIASILIFLLQSTFTWAESTTVSNQLRKIDTANLNVLWILGLAFALLALVLIFYVSIEKKSFSDKNNFFKTQIFDQVKIEEIRTYLLYIGFIAPLSEIVIWYYELRINNELLANFSVGFTLLIFYFLSKTNIFIRINIFRILILFFLFFLFSNIYKISTSPFELINYSEYLLIVFFSSYVLLNRTHYILFIATNAIFLLSLFFNPIIPLKDAVLFSTISYMILILNFVRQKVINHSNDKMFFANSIVNEGISLVIASNKEGEITFISQNVKQILGYLPDELLGNGWWEKTIDNNTEIENEKHKIVTQFFNEEISTRLIRTKTGEYKWIQWHDKRFNADLVVGIGQDITELKKLENERNLRHEKLLIQQNILNEVNKIQLDHKYNFEGLIEYILKITTNGLEADIVSLIRYEDEALKIIKMYEKNSDSFMAEHIIDLSMYPIYTEALKLGQPIVVNNVLEKEETQEFINGYFKTNNIKSLIDLPIYIGGQLKYLISCETVQEFKEWDSDDINFIRNISDIISLSIENQKRKEAENLVFESENIFRQINETIDNVFWLYDLINHKVLYISPSCDRILGASQKNFYEKNDYWTKYILKEDRPTIIENHRKIGTQGFYEIEYRINKNGEIRWIKEKSYAIQDENGTVVKNSGICTDITDEKLIQEELKQLSLIAEKTTNGVSISNLEGEVIWVNQGYLDLFEIEIDQILGKKPRNIFINDDEDLTETFNQLNGTDYKFEFKANTFKGKIIWVEINNTVIKNNKGEFIQQIDVLTDITDRVLDKQKIENQSLILEEYAKDLEYQNTLKEKLIHADTITDVCFNTLSFIEDQLDNSHHVSIIFPDINGTYYSGYTFKDQKLEEEGFFASELNCLEHAKVGEIYFKEDLEIVENKSISDAKYLEQGIKSYIVVPMLFKDDFVGIMLIGFNVKLILSFKQITYLKEACSVIAATINQIQLKHILQTKNHDILSSILYAKNIQSSALPDLKTFSTKIKNVSLFYRPKDIVSGDFYWAKETEEHCFIAIGDCTGHGVPGAFLTLLGINILEQLIGFEKKTSPADILSHLDQRLYEALNNNKQESVINDGMELGLCVYHKATRKVQFAGAGLGILYFFNNEEIHVRGYRITIGDARKEKFEFENTEIDITGLEYFFMASDGYQDQLGGTKYKRFSKNKLIQLLNDIKFKEPEDQERILMNVIDEYIGNYSQLDDFTVLGFTIKP